MKPWVKALICLLAAAVGLLAYDRVLVWGDWFPASSIKQGPVMTMLRALQDPAARPGAWKGVLFALLFPLGMAFAAWALLNPVDHSMMREDIGSKVLKEAFQGARQEVAVDEAQEQSFGERFMAKLKALFR